MDLPSIDQILAAIGTSHAWPLRHGGRVFGSANQKHVFTIKKNKNVFYNARLWPSLEPWCRLLIVPPSRGSSRFEKLILSHHSGRLYVSVMKRTLMNVMNDVQHESLQNNLNRDTV